MSTPPRRPTPTPCGERRAGILTSAPSTSRYGRNLFAQAAQKGPDARRHATGRGTQRNRRPGAIFIPLVVSPSNHATSARVSQRRRWAFFSSLLADSEVAAEVIQGPAPGIVGRGLAVGLGPRVIEECVSRAWVDDHVSLSTSLLLSVRKGSGVRNREVGFVFAEKDETRR